MQAVPFADLIADLSVLTAAQTATGPFLPGRIVLGWVCLLLGNAAASQSTAIRSSCVVLSGLLAAAVIAPRREPACVLESALCMLLAAFCAAGAAMLGGSALPWASMGAAAAACMLRARRHIRAQWNIDVSLNSCGAQCVFRALIDTGNRLRDNRTGLPVLIVERDAVAEILDRLPPEKLHALPYSVLGSGGNIECFAPEHLTFRFPGEPDRRAPRCRIAVFPGSIPGRTQALAPPEFLTAISPNPRISDLKRRFRHVVFERTAVHLRSGDPDQKGFGVLHRRQRSAPAAAEPRRGD